MYYCFSIRLKIRKFVLNMSDEEVVESEEPDIADEPINDLSTPELSFSDPSLNLSPQLIFNLKRRGLIIPTEVQLQVIPKIHNERGKDLCVNAPTGSGKTLAYVLPVVEVRSPLCAPLIMIVPVKTIIYCTRMPCRSSNS